MSCLSESEDPLLIWAHYANNHYGLCVEYPISIILGCATKPEFEQEVIDYCSANKINLYKMEKDPIEYRLNKKVVMEFDKED